MAQASPKPVLALAALPGNIERLLGPEFRLRIAQPGHNLDLVPDREDVVGLLVTVADRVDEPLIEGLPSLRAVATASAGTDHLDLPALAARQIAAAAVPGVLTETTADLCWALILAAARRLGEAERILRGGTWQGWSPLFLTGVDVYGKTLGIVGMGRIGSAVARRAQGFGMKLLYHNRRPSPVAETLCASLLPLEELLPQSDIVVLALPGGPETRGRIGAAELAAMREDAVLVNVGRGDLLDMTALSDELQRGRFAGVGLDVYPEEPLPPDHPILRHERVVALPHIGSATYATRIRMTEGAARSLRALLTDSLLLEEAVRIL